MQTEPLERTLSGAAAGLAATIPMTAAIALCQSRMPPVDRLTPPPPHQVAMEVASALGLKSHLELDERLLFSLLTHFGYGAGAGALYGLGTEADEPSPGTRGIAFGCLVWAGSYLGWLQAAGFRAAADGQSLRRNGMMLAAHVVWGWTLGTVYSRLRRHRAASLERDRTIAGLDIDQQRSPSEISAGGFESRDEIPNPRPTVRAD